MCSIKWRIMLFHLFSGMLPGEQYLSECTVPSVKSSGVGIVVLSCFSGVGLSPLARVKETLNASAYKNILQQFHAPNSVGIFWRWVLPVPT